MSFIMLIWNIWNVQQNRHSKLILVAQDCRVTLVVAFGFLPRNFRRQGSTNGTLSLYECRMSGGDTQTLTTVINLVRTFALMGNGDTKKLLLHPTMPSQPQTLSHLLTSNSHLVKLLQNIIEFGGGNVVPLQHNRINSSTPLPWFWVMGGVSESKSCVVSQFVKWHILKEISQHISALWNLLPDLVQETQVDDEKLLWQSGGRWKCIYQGLNLC